MAKHNRDDPASSTAGAGRSFKSAWHSLLSLQSTGTALERSFQRRSETLHMMRFYVRELGIDVQALGKRVIHVAGTKGKGSTCAFAESVLRARGYRTALFTSPHLQPSARAPKRDILFSWRGQVLNLPLSLPLSYRQPAATDTPVDTHVGCEWQVLHHFPKYSLGIRQQIFHLYKGR